MLWELSLLTASVPFCARRREALVSFVRRNNTTSVVIESRLVRHVRRATTWRRSQPPGRGRAGAERSVTPDRGAWVEQCRESRMN
eukprot:379201-Pleurochrysis_carterae.AAC.1